MVGASSGLGEAMARQLHAAGANVALVARRKDELDRIAAELNAARPGSAFALAHDVRDFAEAPAALEQCVAALGGLDFVAYAAGILPPLAESEWSFEKDRATMEVNVLGAMAWLNPIAARFEAARGGTILGVSSVAGERGRRGHPSYGASKAALTTYLEALRNRLARYGVTVTTVKPGFIDTAMTKGRAGLFWLISPEEAASQALALARRGVASGYVPARWAPLMLVVKAIPDFVFKKLNF